MKLNFREREYETVLAIMEQINKDRCGLEFSGIYNILAVLGKYHTRQRGGDRAVWNIAPKSMGKGESIKYGEMFEDTNIIVKRDKITSTYFIAFVQKQQLDTVCIIIEDISTIIDNDYHVKDFFNLASKLLWDRNIGSGTKDMLEMECENIIEMKGTTVLIGGTPKNLAHIRSFYQAYTSMWKDRITEYLYFFDNKSSEKINSNILNSMFNTKKQEVKYFKPEDGLPEEHIEFDLRVDKSKISMLYDQIMYNQHSPNRGQQLISTDLKSLAWLNGREYVTESDIYFYYLYKLNLTKSLMKRRDYLALFYALQKPDYGYVLDNIQLSMGTLNQYLWNNPYINWHKGDKFIKINPEILDLLMSQRLFIDKYVTGDEK